MVLYRIMNGTREPFMVTGQRVTALEKEKALMRRMSGEELDSPTFASEAFSYVLKKACAFKKEDRYQNVYEMQDDQTMYGAMTDGLKQDEAGDAMEVAFYLGNCKVMGDTKRFPWCITDNGNATTQNVSSTDVPGADRMTLVLRYTYGRYMQDFNAAAKIDTNEKHVIQIKSAHRYDLLTPFLIHGRLFVCQQLKYTYADGRQHPIVEGTFYPYI